MLYICALRARRIKMSNHDPLLEFVGCFLFALFLVCGAILLSKCEMPRSKYAPEILVPVNCEKCHTPRPGDPPPYWFRAADPLPQTERSSQ